MMSNLLLGGEVVVTFEEREGNYKLEDLTSMMSRLVEYVGRREKKIYTLFCTASKRQSSYRVRIELINTKGEEWFIGKIIFPKAPV